MLLSQLLDFRKSRIHRKFQAFFQVGNIYIYRGLSNSDIFRVGRALTMKYVILRALPTLWSFGFCSQLFFDEPHISWHLKRKIVWTSIIFIFSVRRNPPCMKLKLRKWFLLSRFGCGSKFIGPQNGRPNQRIGGPPIFGAMVGGPAHPSLTKSVGCVWVGATRRERRLRKKKKPGVDKDLSPPWKTNMTND